MIEISSCALSPNPALGTHLILVGSDALNLFVRLVLLVAVAACTTSLQIKPSPDGKEQ